MSTTHNAEVRDYMRQVRDVVNSVKSQVAWHGFADVERRLGLDQLVDEQTVVVRVTLPAATPEEAVSEVVEQVRYVDLPSGWDLDVASA